MNDPDNVKSINKTSRQKAHDEAKRFVYEYLVQKSCQDCGERDITVSTFDHVRGTKKMNIADMISGGYSVTAIKNELEKTDVVCFNCHMRREQKRRGSERFNRI